MTSAAVNVLVPIMHVFQAASAGGSARAANLARKTVCRAAKRRESF